MKAAVIGFAVVVAGASGCKKAANDAPAPTVVEGKPAQPEPVKPEPVRPVAPAAPLAGEALAKFSQSCWDAFSAQKWDAFGGCYADDVTSTALGMPPNVGRSAVVADAKAWLAAFPDAKFEPQLVLVSGRTVTEVRWFRATQSGALTLPSGTVPATNKPVSFLMLHQIELGDANRVKREAFAFDVGTLLLQLGKGPGPGRALLDKPWPGAPMIVIAKDDETERKNAAAIKAGYDQLNKRDFKSFDALMADDIVESFNNEPADTVGKKAVQEENNGLIAAFSDIRVDVDTVWAAGDYTVGFEHVRGTNDGTLGPLVKTGRKLDWTAIEIIRWKDGKVEQSLPFNNGMEFSTQLGLVPAK